jgi:hypothetical protein
MAMVKDAIAAFHERGELSEEQYRALRAALAPASGHATSQTFDGLVGLFFERHVMHDRWRAELMAMDEGRGAGAMGSGMRNPEGMRCSLAFAPGLATPDLPAP